MTQTGAREPLGVALNRVERFVEGRRMIDIAAPVDAPYNVWIAKEDEPRELLLSDLDRLIAAARSAPDSLDAAEVEAALGREIARLKRLQAKHHRELVVDEAHCGVCQRDRALAALRLRESAS